MLLWEFAKLKLRDIDFCLIDSGAKVIIWIDSWITLLICKLKKLIQICTKDLNEKLSPQNFKPENNADTS